MVAFVEPSVVIGDHSADAYIRLTPGYTDECDRLSLKVEIQTGTATGEFRLCINDAMDFAKKIIELSVGRQTILTINGWSIEETDYSVTVTSSVNFWLPEAIIRTLTAATITT